MKKKQQQQQQGRTSESSDGDAAPPLPARMGQSSSSSSASCNGQKSARSLSFSTSKDGGLGQPPPIPSRPSTTTSTRSNSVSSVVGMGVAGGSNSNLVDASFATGQSSSSTTSSYVSSLLTRNAQTLSSVSDSPSRMLGGGGDRINPFDKGVINGEGASSSSPGVGRVSDVSSFNSGESSSSAKTTPGTTLDDLIKNRFAKTQGVQDEATGRYKPKLSDAKAEPSFEDMKNELFRKEEKKVTPPTPPPKEVERKWSESDSVFSTSISPKVDPVKPSSTSSFSKFSRTNSSDAEIIFGSTSGASPLPSGASPRPKYNYSIDSQSSISSDADNIFGRKEEGRSFLKSLSVSSTDDREFSADPRVKNYEGVQNAAFTETDSGLGSTASYKSTTGSTSSMGSTSYKWSGNNSRLAEEDYDDLK